MHFGKTAAAKFKRLNECAMRCIFNGVTLVKANKLCQVCKKEGFMKIMNVHTIILTNKAIYATALTPVSGLLSLRSNKINVI